MPLSKHMMGFVVTSALGARVYRLAGRLSEVVFNMGNLKGIRGHLDFIEICFS